MYRLLIKTKHGFILCDHAHPKYFVKLMNLIHFTIIFEITFEQ